MLEGGKEPNLSPENSRNFDELSRAITNAISKAEDVKKALYTLYSQKKINKDSLLILVLKTQAMDNMINYIHKVVQKNNKLSTAKKDERIISDFTEWHKIKIGKKTRQYIDGKPLSEKEIDFEEFFIENFDVEAWMKEHGLSFDN